MALNKFNLGITLLLFGFKAYSQSVEMTVGTGQNSFYLKSGTPIAINKLSITPSADFQITNTQLSSSTTLTNTSNQPYIPFVYRFSNTVSSYSGTILANYTGVSIPAGITEANLKLKYHDGLSWNTATTASLNTTTDLLETSILSGVSINEITLSDITGTLAITPCAGDLSGSQEICIGATTTFSSTVAGGTWSSSNLSVASINSSGVITGVAAGTVTITYSVNGTGSCASATSTRTVTVSAAPTAGTLSGTQSICVNGTTQITTNGSTGGIWTISNSSVASITGATSGTANSVCNLSDIPNNLQNGLVAFYPFCNNLNDISSNSYNATIASGSVPFVTDRRGNSSSALQLGSGYLTSSSSVFNFQRNQSFSVSLWFTDETASSNGRLLSTECPEGNFRIAAYNNGSYAVQYGDYIYDDVSLNTWNHLSYTYNNRTEKVYINGILKYTNTDNSNESLNFCSPFTFGAKASSGSDRWIGKIDDVVVHNRELSATEVSELYSTQLSSGSTVSGLSAGTATITYTVNGSGGCPNSSSNLLITVTAANTAGAASSTPTLCINTALTSITHATTGATGIGTATGLPAGVTATWAGNVITISGTPAASGTFSYSIPLTGGCGSVNATGTITVTANNTISLSSAAGTNAQTKCISTAITNITYSTTGATGATVTGLPAGVNGSWSGNVVTISGMPTTSGTFTYTVTMTGGCTGGTNTATGTITVTAANTAAAASSTPTLCINTALTNITHATTGATGIGSATGLPAGVTAAWAGNVITISGTPTASGTFSYSIPLTGGCGSVNATGTITVTTANTAGAASSTPTLCINTALTSITHATTGATGIGTATGLPAGVTAAWVGNVITISGTPTASGIFNYSIPLTGGCGSVNATGTITVTANNTISLSSAVGTNAQTKCISTAITNITYSTTGATGATVTGLPAGVNGSWSGNVVTISGMPTTSGTFTYTVTMTGGCTGGTNTATGTITVTAANTAAAASSTPTLCINTALTNITHATTGATGIGSATGLPAGVTAAWAGNVITISGTPTASGTFSYSIPLTGGCGSVNATGTITVTTANTAAAASSTPTLCINTALTSITHATTGATGIGSATGLPAGVTAAWVGNVITISGTPTASGIFNYSIPLTGGCGSVNATGTITVTAANTAAAASSTPTLCINTALTSITHATTGATGIGTATGLPAGVTAAWASNRITISGTPTASGVFNYSVPLTGGCGSISATGTITVTAANTAAAASSTPTLCINTALTSITHATTGATGIGTSTGLPAGVTAAWASNRITISGTPTASGTFNYSIPMTGGCGSVNATGTITVTARPVAGTLGGAQAICVLGSSTFSSTISGGAWSSSANTVATVDATSGVVSGIAAGTATITYTITGTGGCADVSATRTVTVTAMPSAGTLSGTQEICLSGTTTLSSTVSGGTWTSATTSVATIDATTGVVAGITAGTSVMTYTVTGTGGCADVSATRTVIVTTPPSAGLLSGPQDLCVAGTTSLTSTVSGGTWSSSAVSVASINATTGVATGVVAGIATMTYTVAGTGGCANATATRNVTVNAPPNAGTLSGIQAICVSASVLFNSTSAGGTWSSSNSLIATINASTGSVSGIAPGTATMTYVVPGTGGCANASATRTVTVTAAPEAGTLSGNQSICVGGNTSLSSSVTGGTWNTSASAIATINSTSGFVAGITAGTATMTYTVVGTGGCTNASATRTVTVTAAPVAGILSGTQAICIAGTSTLSSSISGGTWTSSNGSIATINSSTGFVTGVATGTATMTYTVTGTGGCANATATRLINVTAPPNAGTLSGVQAICVGGISSFNSSITGGTWTSSDNTIAPINNTTGFITGLTAGTVTMTYTVTGTGGCADVSTTRTLTVTAPPVAGTLSGGTSICITGTTVFTSTVTGGTWTSSNNSVALINAATGIVTGVDAGTAIMTYTVAGTGGCANTTATRTVTVNANNTVSAPSALPTLCISTLLTPITHTTTGGTGIGIASGLPLGVSATWSSNTISISGTPLQSGTFNYIIPLRGGCGRDSAVGVIIVRPDNIVSTPSSTPTVCINSSLPAITHTTTGATGIGTAIGLPAGVIATWAFNTISITGTPTQSGTFTYSIPLTGGCGTIFASGVIIVAPLPTGTISSSTNLLCEGGSVQLMATGGNSYQWFINGGAIVGATNATHAATQPGTYTVNLTSSTNCIAPASGSVTLQLVQKPTVNFSYDKYCAGFPTQFTDQSNTANSNVVTYSWSFGTGQGNSTLQNPTYSFPTASTYSVSLVVTPVSCPSLAASLTKPITTVAPPPNLRYTSLNAVENRDLQLEARIFTGASYSWTPSAGLSNTTINNPFFNYNTEVDYVITITTGIGCVIKDTQLVRIFKEKEIYVPKGFSPNGDGNNDKIFPRLVGVRTLTYFKIFNRWGKLLFQTSNINEGWDGVYSGAKQPMETYVWIAEGVDIDNNLIKRTGTFLLLR